MTIHRALLLSLLLPLSALACTQYEQNETLLYASAFRLAEAGSCGRLEEAEKEACLDRVLTGSARRQPELEALLALIHRGNVRQLGACNKQQLRAIKRQGGEDANLWVCHRVYLQQADASKSGQTMALAMMQTAAFSVRIGQVILLPEAPQTSQDRAPNTIDSGEH